MKIITKSFSRLRIRHIIYIYFLVNILLGMLYFLLTTYVSVNHGLAFQGIPLSRDYLGFFNSLYFSFVTSSSLGYGDIVPFGTSKVIAIFEVIFGLLVLSLFVTKLVSKKQEVLLQSMYHSSFIERSRNLRSGLYRVRDGIEEILKKIDKNKISKNELSDSLVLRIMSFYTHLSDIYDILQEKMHIKEMDQEKLILHLLLSLKSFNNLFLIISEKKMSIKKSEIEMPAKLVIQTIDKIHRFLDSKKTTINMKGFNKRIQKKNGQFKKWIEKISH